MHADFGLERLCRSTETVHISGRTVEALGEGEEPEASGHGESNGYEGHGVGEVSTSDSDMKAALGTSRHRGLKSVRRVVSSLPSDRPFRTPR
jgi:hypothetical protein